MNHTGFVESSSVNASQEDVYHSGQSSQDNVTVSTMLGETRTLAGLERNEWIFLILSVSCMLATAGLTIEKLRTSDKDSPDCVFAILLLINAGFCLFYAVHGVLREREYELYCVIVAVLIVSVYVIANFISTFSHSSMIKEVRLILICVFVPFIIGFAGTVGQGFGYLQFKIVGANAEVQAMYRAACKFSGLLKIDFQLVLILLVLTIEKCSDVPYFSKCSLAVGVPLQMLAALIGWIAMRTEQLALVWLFLPLCLAEPVYIGFRISQLVEKWQYYTCRENNLDSITYSFIAAAGCAMFIRILLVYALYAVVNNFGRRLKYKVFQLPEGDDEPVILARKRDVKKCCGIICCGPIG